MLRNPCLAFLTYSNFVGIWVNKLKGENVPQHALLLGQPLLLIAL